MGNIQTGDAKSSKSAKSPGKVKALIKIRGKRGKIEGTHFTGIVPEEDDQSHYEANRTHTPEIIKKKEKTNINSPLNTNITATATMENKTDKPYITDSWQKVNNIPPTTNVKTVNEITPSSAESSSDSVFMDPLTPAGFSTEINQCYYSEENVNIDVVVPDSYENNFLNLPLNNFKLNEYKARKEKKLTEKLSKLGISKTSQISLNNDPRESFVSPNIECVKKADESGIEKDLENSANDFNYSKSSNVPLHLSLNSTCFSDSSSSPGIKFK